MLLHGQFRRASLNALIVGALVASSSYAEAQNTRRQLFEWRGRVDREIQIAMRGREAWVQGTSRTDVRGTTPAVSGALPRTDGFVQVTLQDGRGEAEVLQQPSSRNDYTTLIAIRDRSGGADSYRVNAFWMGPDVRDDESDRDRRGRDDEWERDRRGRIDDRDGRGGRGPLARNTFRWSGSVDHGLEIHIQGDRVWYRNLGGKGTRNVHEELSRRGLPQDNVELSVRRHEGRGDVFVVQQPTRRNGYTAVIRVLDPRPSYGHYEFDVVWRDSFASRR
jgi:hypothetical protein